MASPPHPPRHDEEEWQRAFDAGRVAGRQDEVLDRLDKISGRLDGHISSCRSLWISLACAVVAALGGYIALHKW